MIKIGEIRLTEIQQEVIIRALIIYDKRLRDIPDASKTLKTSLKTLNDIAQLIFNEKKKIREYKPTIDDYFEIDGNPIKCIDCGCTNMKTIIKDRIEGTVSELAYICVDCGNETGYWAVGHFNPGYRLDGIEQLKEKTFA